MSAALPLTEVATRQRVVVTVKCLVLTATGGQRPGLAEDVAPPVVRLLRKPFALTALLETVRAAVTNKGLAGPFDRHRTPPCSELFIG